MRIVRHGKRWANPEVHGICTTCSCQVAFNLSEAKRVSDQRDGDFYQVKCPECASGYINVDAQVAEGSVSGATS